MNSISILSCGWLGLPLAKHLVKRGYLVKGSTTSDNKLSELELNGIKPYKINLGVDFQQEWKGFLDCNILIVCFPPSINKQNPKLPLKQVIKGIEKNGIEKVIYTSATSVYPNNNSIVTEKDAEYIESPHSGTKMLELEELFTKNEKFSTCVLRFGGLFGESRLPGKFLSGRKDLKNGKHPINMIHLSDCIHIIHKIIQLDAFPQVFNACSDIHPSRSEFYTTAIKKQGFEEAKFNNENDGQYKIVSSEKLKRKLGYEFIYSNPIDAL